MIVGGLGLVATTAAGHIGVPVAAPRITIIRPLVLGDGRGSAAALGRRSGELEGLSNARLLALTFAAPSCCDMRAWLCHSRRS